MDISTIISSFNKWANSYDADIATANWGFEYYSNAIDWICYQLVHNIKSDRIIDLGCGTGIVAERLEQLKSQTEYIGIDLSPSMLNIAKNKIPTSTFIEADIRDYDKWIKYLDPRLNCTVISTYALHHINDEEKIKLLKHIFSVAKRRDFLFVVVDYAFFDSSERIKIFDEQNKLFNFHIMKEIESEYYANLSYLRSALSQNRINLSFEKNGVWDWRYFLCQV